MFDQFNVDVIKYSFLYFYRSCLPIDLGEFRGFYYTPALWIGAYDVQAVPSCQSCYAEKVIMLALI